LDGFAVLLGQQAAEFLGLRLHNTGGTF
jgi:hypothetical protein